MLVKSIGKLVKCHDPETGDHGVQIAKLCHVIKNLLYSSVYVLIIFLLSVSLCGVPVFNKLKFRIGDNG